MNGIVHTDIHLNDLIINDDKEKQKESMQGKID